MLKFAVRGFLIGAILWANAALPQEPKGPPDNPAETAQQGQPTKAKESPSDNPAPPALAPKEQIPTTVKQDPRDASDYNAREDLAAQRRMAVAAEELVNLTDEQIKITAIEAVLLAVTIFFTAWAAVAASKAASAADKAVEITDKTAKHQLRAYLSLSPAGVHYDVSARTLSALVTQKNSGQTPAKKVRFSGIFEFYPFPLPENFDFSEPIFGDSVNVVAPGDKFQITVTRDGVIYEMDLTDTDCLVKRLYFVGTIEYEDIFGDEYETKSCWFYENGEIIRVMKLFSQQARSTAKEESTSVSTTFHYTEHHNEAT